MQTAPEKCAEATCGHAPFPHRLSVTPATTVYRRVAGKLTATELPAREHLICLTCHHWPNSGSVAANRTCQCVCHEHAAEYETI